MFLNYTYPSGHPGRPLPGKLPTAKIPARPAFVPSTVKEPDLSRQRFFHLHRKAVVILLDEELVVRYAE